MLPNAQQMICRLRGLSGAMKSIKATRKAARPNQKRVKLGTSISPTIRIIPKISQYHQSAVNAIVPPFEHGINWNNNYCNILSFIKYL